MQPYLAFNLETDTSIINLVWTLGFMGFLGILFTLRFYSKETMPPKLIFDTEWYKGQSGTSGRVVQESTENAAISLLLLTQKKKFEFNQIDFFPTCLT